ncbi:unnamed protein product [Closterium sp. NIES-54]
MPERGVAGTTRIVTSSLHTFAIILFVTVTCARCDDLLKSSSILQPQSPGTAVSRNVDDRAQPAHEWTGSWQREVKAAWQEARQGRRRAAAEVAFASTAVASRARPGTDDEGGESGTGTTGSNTATTGSTSGASGSTSGPVESGKERQHGRNTEGGNPRTTAVRKDSSAVGGSDIGSESGRDSASAASADFTDTSSAMSPSRSPLSSSPSSPSLASLLSQHHRHLQQWQRHLDRAVFTPLTDPTQPLAVMSKILKNSPKVPLLVAVDGRVPDAVAGGAWEQAGGRMARVTWRKGGGREAGRKGEMEGRGGDQGEVGDGDRGGASQGEEESVGAGEERRVEGGGVRRRLGVVERRKWRVGTVKEVGTSEERSIQRHVQEQEEQQNQQQQQQQWQRWRGLLEERRWREGVKARAVSCLAMFQQHETLQGRLAQGGPGWADVPA